MLMAQLLKKNRRFGAALEEYCLENRQALPAKLSSTGIRYTWNETENISMDPVQG